MERSKKPNPPRKGIAKNKKVLIITIILLVSVIGIIGLSNANKNNIKYQMETKYFTGDLYTANHAANMIDYIDTTENVVISPLNVNVSLAILYNGTDNNSNKEIKKYFTKSSSKVNEELLQKLSELEEENIIENEYTKLYESYIKTLKAKGYDTLNVNKLDLLSDKEKEELLLLLKKIELTYSRINDENIITIKEIKKYNLSKNEKTYNSYTIKSLLDKELNNYETYIIKNNVYNYNEIYIDSKIGKKNIEENFLSYIKDFNTIISEYSTENIETTTKEINDKVKDLTNENIKRVVEQSDITDNKIIMINSLYFNYEWDTNIQKSNVINEEFYNADESIGAVEMMYTKENIYLENDYAQGFIKNFENGKYSFIGVLPKKSGDFQLSTLDLNNLLLSPKEKKVLVGLPKISYQYETDIESLVSNYGIKEIFSSKSNLSKISSANLEVGKMSQKISITIGEKGTVSSKIDITNIENYEIDSKDQPLVFNRPYAYLIINNETKEVILIGKVTTAHESN